MAVDGVDEAAWWLTRWVSVSMRDPDWDGSWCAMDVVGTFEALARAVGADLPGLTDVLWSRGSEPLRGSACRG